MIASPPLSLLKAPPAPEEPDKSTCDRSKENSSTFDEQKKNDNYCTEQTTLFKKSYSPPVQLPYLERFRAKSLEQLVLPKKVFNLIKGYIHTPLEMPHLLLSGPSGTGKTTIAKIIANNILGGPSAFNFLVLNASMDRGVDIIRNQVHSFVSNKAFLNLTSKKAPYKIVFLDQADALTSDAQNALRNLMETYIENARFILSCNEPMKITAPIHSRVQSISFQPISKAQMLQKLNELVLKNDLPIALEKIEQACINSKGDFRKALNLLADLQHIDFKDQLESIAQYITSSIKKKKSINQIYQVLVLKKQTIIQNLKEVFATLMVHAIESSLDLHVIDRLSRAEFAVILGANPLTQITGWIAYWHSFIAKQKSN